MIKQPGVKTVTTSSATWRVETMPDGKTVKNIELVECNRVPKAVTIEDGLIVRCPDMPYGGHEYKGQLVKIDDELLFTIVSRIDGAHSARGLANGHPIVKALIKAGWTLRDVWKVVPNEF